MKNLKECIAACRKATVIIRSTLGLSKTAEHLESLPREIIEAFMSEVNDRAEKNMLQTGRLEGSHYAAMQKVYADYFKTTEPPTDIKIIASTTDDPSSTDETPASQPMHKSTEVEDYVWVPKGELEKILCCGMPPGTPYFVIDRWSKIVHLELIKVHLRPITEVTLDPNARLNPDTWVLIQMRNKESVICKAAYLTDTMRWSLNIAAYPHDIMKYAVLTKDTLAQESTKPHDKQLSQEAAM